MNGPFEGELTERLFWRDEILQAMYWMRGEGLGDVLTARGLSGLLDANPVRIHDELQRLVTDGLVDEEPGGDGGYLLTELGMELGRQSFEDEFAGMTGSAHGACGPGCDCRRHAGAAAACRAAR